MHSEGDEAIVTAEPEARTWDWILGQLTLQLPELVDDFLVEFTQKEPYPADQVAQQDIVDTARETFELLIRRLRGEPDPPGAAGLIERLAARRAQQGVSLATFLQAVRIDFRVMWLRVQRIAGEGGNAVLADNVMHLLDTVENYVDALREAYRAEASRIDHTVAVQRQRMILRLFSGEPLTASDAELIARRLRLHSAARYEVVAVTGEAINAMIARYGNDRSVGVFESASAAVLFREQRAPEQWRRDIPSVGGYVGDIQGLVAVPAAAEVALEIAKNVPDEPQGLSTEEEVWATVARRRLLQAFPRFTGTISQALEELPDHERSRLVEAVQTYFRTGSIKVTAEALYCHRNTVINRLRTFEEVTGFDPTVPRDAAWIYVALPR